MGGLLKVERCVSTGSRADRPRLPPRDCGHIGFQVEGHVDGQTKKNSEPLNTPNTRKQYVDFGSAEFVKGARHKG